MVLLNLIHETTYCIIIITLPARVCVYSCVRVRLFASLALTQAAYIRTSVYMFIGDGVFVNEKVSHVVSIGEGILHITSSSWRLLTNRT